MVLSVGKTAAVTVDTGTAMSSVVKNSLSIPRKFLLEKWQHNDRQKLILLLPLADNIGA